MGKDTKQESSDDESEAQFVSVSNYHLEDEDREFVSFAVLPFQWGEAKKNYGATKEQVFLHGFADNGLKMIMMQVVAWRFDLSRAKPEISLLLSKDKRWIKLQKPRNNYQDTIRTILITVHFLHRVKKNAEISAKSVWDSLFKDKELSSYKFKPSQKDLFDHLPLIGDAAQRFVVLSKSKLLLTVLKEKLGNKKLSDEKVKDLIRPALIVDDVDNGVMDEANKESKAEDDSSNSVCAICDDGGTLFSCEGPCLRSFHLTKKDGIGSMCDSLGFTQKEADGIKNFYCKNCEYNQHQCFACGKLGSSGKVKGAEVIKCASASCSHFYHPHCVAKLLPKVVKNVAKEHETNVADAKSFTCPVHYCCVCKEVENTLEPELQFAVCARCPKSYHRKCLPREIIFTDTDEDILPRAWEGLLPENRILIYCLKHEINEEIGTPVRNHIKFPNVKSTVPEINDTEEKLKPATKQSNISNKNNVHLDNLSGKNSAKGSKVTGKVSPRKVSPSVKSTVPKISDTMEKMKPAIKQRVISNKNNVDLDNSSGKNSAKGSKVAGKPSPGKVSPNVKDTIPKISDTKGKLKLSTKQSVISNKNNIDLDNSSGKSSAKGSKVTGKLTPGKIGSEKTSEKIVSASNISTKPKANGTSRSCLTENKTSISEKFEVPDTDDNQPLHVLMTNCSKQTKPTKVSNAVCETPSVKPIRQPLPANDQRNVKRPLLSNRSHSDSTTKHKVIVRGQGNVSSQHQVSKMQSSNIETFPADRTTKLTDDQEDQASMNGGQKSSYCGNVNQESKDGEESKMSKSCRTLLKRKHSEENDTRGPAAVLSAKRQASVEHHSREDRADRTMNGNCVDKILSSRDLSKSTDDQEDQACINRGQKSSSHGNGDQESREGQESKMSKSGRTSLKRKHTEENDTRGQGEVSSAKRQAVSEMLEGVPGHSQPKAIDDGKPAVTCPHGEIRNVPSVEEHHSEEEEKDLRESDIRQQYMRYGYAQPCSVSGSSYKINAPAVPTRLDEFYRDTMGSVGSKPPAVCRNGTSERRVPQCGYVDSFMGFAPGPHPFAYSRHNSSGWITD